jgi:hypothetical protein
MRAPKGPIIDGKAPLCNSSKNQKNTGFYLKFEAVYGKKNKSRRSYEPGIF